MKLESPDEQNQISALQITGDTGDAGNRPRSFFT